MTATDNLAWCSVSGCGIFLNTIDGIETGLCQDHRGAPASGEPYRVEEDGTPASICPTPDDTPPDSDGPRLWKATDLVGARQPEWLAKYRIPRSAVTILVGDEGIGKSLFWVWIAAAVTTGRALSQFGVPARAPENVLLVITEDEWSYAVRPRLDVAGADLDRIMVICTEEDGSGSPVFPRDMHLVDQAGASLVVVDAFLDTVAANLTMKDPQQARLALHPWKEAATTTGAAIMLLTHTNRVDSRNARDRYGITGELRKKARMTLYAQLDDEERLVIGPEKSNIVGKVSASAFRIDPVQVFPPTEEHDGTVPLLHYVGESELTAREHVQANHAAGHGEDIEDRTEAERWLKDYLTNAAGMVESKTVKAEAKKQIGASDRTLKRAAKSLGVKFESVGFPRCTYWSLPDQQSGQSGQADSYHSEGDPTGPTGSDKGFYSGPTAQSGQSGHTQGSGATGEPTGVTSQPGPVTGADATAASLTFRSGKATHATNAPPPPNGESGAEATCTRCSRQLGATSTGGICRRCARHEQALIGGDL